MGRALTLVVAVGASLIAMSTPAAACSVGPGFDARRETDVFVVGRITSISVTATPAKTAPGIRTAYLSLDVVSVLRGSAPSRITITDPGAGDGCSALQGEPSSYLGQFAAFALKRATTDTGVVVLYSNRLYGAAFGRTVDAEPIRSLTAYHQLRLPATSTATDPLVPELPIAGLVALVAVMSARRARGRAANQRAARPRVNSAR